MSLSNAKPPPFVSVYYDVTTHKDERVQNGLNSRWITYFKINVTKGG